MVPNDFLFGLEPKAALTALGMLVSLIVVTAAVRSVVRRRFSGAPATETLVDDWALELANRTKLWLLFFPMLTAVTRGLPLPQELADGIRTLGRLGLIAQAALWTAGMVTLAWRRYARSRIEADRAAVTTVHAFRLASLVVVWTVAVLVAIDNLGFDVTALVAGLGIGGVAIALATQSILGDLFASLSIVVDKPFVVGDDIRVGDDGGTVERIGLKTTRVLAPSGEQLIFGNADLLKSRIRNYRQMRERRVLFQLHVAHGTAAATAAGIPRLVASIIEAQPQTRLDRAHFAAIATSALVFEFVYFVLAPDYALYMDTQQRINLKVLEMCEAEKIELAGPMQMPQVSTKRA